jgi:hypothetical protein
MISDCKVYGIEDSVRASKYPMSEDVTACTGEITARTNSLATCEKGTGHDQFLTGIIAQFDLTFTIKAWTEAERYHFFDFVSSQSTMHRIVQIDVKSQCISYVTENTIAEVERLKETYNANPSAENYLTLLYNVPVGLKLTARMTTNYRQLKTIYSQPKTHRLPEWKRFCEQLESFPHAEWITGSVKKDDKQMQNLRQGI